MPLENPTPVPLGEMVPPPGRFRHASERHGQKHVARVMVHAFRLLGLTGHPEETLRLWASVYLHDLERTHDGRCSRHGRDAARLLERSPELERFFRGAGLEDNDLEAVKIAVSRHCGGPEPVAGEPQATLIRLLKDADGLDRVRLGDLDPSYFRFPVTPSLVLFAERLYVETNHLPECVGYFERLLAEALGVMDGA